MVSPLQTSQIPTEYENVFRIRRLPFVNNMCNIDIPDLNSPDAEFERCAEKTFENYKNCLRACIKDAKLRTSDDPVEFLNTYKNTFNHNFLMTSRWLLVVLRSRSEVKSLGFNSLAFTGEILVKNKEQLETILDVGPIKMLLSACYEYK